MLAKTDNIASPLTDIVWKSADELTANDYNPNVVQPQELELIELSLRKHGWLQAILVTQHNVIIDGFHRWSISKKNGWQVPCIVFDMTEQERKLLTIRINRAKGTHVAVRMSDIVKSLVNDGLSREYVAEQIGAKIFEVNLLLEDSIFTKHNVEQHTYSKSWVPNKKK